MLKSLNDPDAGVRKLALKTTAMLKRGEFSRRVAEIEKSDPAEHSFGMMFTDLKENRGQPAGAISRARSRVFEFQAQSTAPPFRSIAQACDYSGA